MEAPRNLVRDLKETAKRAKDDAGFIQVYRTMKCFGRPCDPPPHFFSTDMEWAMFAMQYSWYKIGRGEAADIGWIEL